MTFGSDMSTAMGDSDEAKKRRKNFGDRHNCADKNRQRQRQGTGRVV